jgi:hypothetical protein
MQTCQKKKTKTNIINVSVNLDQIRIMDHLFLSLFFKPYGTMFVYVYNSLSCISRDRSKQNYFLPNYLD